MSRTIYIAGLVPLKISLNTWRTDIDCWRKEKCNLFSSINSFLSSSLLSSPLLDLLTLRCPCVYYNYFIKVKLKRGEKAYTYLFLLAKQNSSDMMCVYDEQFASFVTWIRYYFYWWLLKIWCFTNNNNNIIIYIWFSVPVFFCSKNRLCIWFNYAKIAHFSSMCVIASLTK